MTEYAHPEVLVTTEWLADHLADPQVRVLERAGREQLERLVRLSGIAVQINQPWLHDRGAHTPRR